MTLSKAAGIELRRDAKTGKPLTFEEIYARYIDVLGGLDAVAPYIPVSLDALREKLVEDPHLNNPALSKWDAAAGFSASTGWNAHQQAYRCQLVGGGLWNLYLQHGITSASCAEGVCILKEATRRLIEQEEA